MTHDNVNHPAHYSAVAKCEHCDGPIEAIVLTESRGFCEGNALKYLLRWRKKGGVEDLKKARWYLDRLIETQEAPLGAGDPSLEVSNG